MSLTSRHVIFDTIHQDPEHPDICWYVYNQSDYPVSCWQSLQTSNCPMQQPLPEVICCSDLYKRMFLQYACAAGFQAISPASELLLAYRPGQTLQ